MGKIRKIILFTLMVLIVSAFISPFAMAKNSNTITVSLRIEGIEKSIYYNKAVNIAVGSTVEDMIKKVNDSDGAPEIIVTNSSYGAYVSEIDGLAEFDYGEMSGWNYRINDVEPSFGISLCKLNDRDSIVYFYGDPYGAGMQYPQTDFSKLFSNGIIRFYSIDTTYDEWWIPRSMVKPVAGAKVTFRWDTYITNDNGEIRVTDKTGLSGFRSLKIERYDETNGIPTVLRYAPDFNLYIPFSDTPQSKPLPWYENAVRYCVLEEYFIGTNLAANLFEPMRNMTMAQLVTVLARIGGVNGELTTGELWYIAPLNWATANGVLPLDEAIIRRGTGALYELTSKTNVTREEFIYMFYLTVKIVGKYDMDVRADITLASDYRKIKENYREAISWAVASGIIEGTSKKKLTINPGLEVNRATVCQMLYNYYT